MITDRHDKPHFVGTAQTNHGFQLPRMVKGDKLVFVTTWTNPNDAENQRQALMQRHIITNRKRYSTGKVRCINTVQHATHNSVSNYPPVTYDTAAAAAKAIGVTPAQMSLHLNNRATYPTIKGYIFERVSE
ncbi:hypothetical protein P106B_80 [Rhizobium phage vB_RglS_P106B]|uniref:Uncharacterized protein n=1 Tax=Rhizobium phage vB_RglS_P106B TaxID=1458697 RepID=W6E9T6_9CAUD|nr:hypothetical protein P106B_80 [Rhizobium phage vB_RglS_P106B]AHJ10763.1 hypothetical protein P106B_80 [Rhizobium phage vB_RglS_P106B]